MRRGQTAALIVVILIALPIASFGQAWSGIINPTRAANWQRADVGVAGGIPSGTWTQCGATIAAYTGSGSVITNAINACGNNQYVLLGPGTFNINDGISIGGFGNQKNNVALRGSGPNSTTLHFTGSGISCVSGGENICVINSNTLYNRSADVEPPCGGSNSGHCFNWTGGYAQGATSITIASVGAHGIDNGDYIILDRQNEQTDNSGVMNCETTGGAPFVCSQEGGSNNGRLLGGIDASQEQTVQVVAGCATTCNGAGPYTLTITPGLYNNNWGSAGPVGGWFVNSSQYVGIENLTLDNANASARANIGVANCANCWVKNIRSIYGNRTHIWLQQVYRMEVRDSYFFGTKNSGNQSYGVEDDSADDSLFENNIFQQIVAPFIGDSGEGSVFGYNYAIDNVYGPSGWLESTVSSHDAGNNFKLFEGNILSNILADQDHGSSNLNTYFRNWIDGLGWNTCTYSGGACINANNYANHPSNQTVAIETDSYQRADNYIGNVLGTPGYHSLYEAYPDGPGTGGSDSKYTSAQCNVMIYMFGWGSSVCGTLAHSGVLDDTLVRNSTMRWGNYDVANAAVRWNSTEASPAAITYVNANTAPSTQTLPASFYLSSMPSFFNTPQGTVPFPPIGPDVSGGNGGTFNSGTYAHGTCPVGTISGGATCQSTYAGHVSVIPAMSCYFNVMGGPTDGSGSVLAFDASNCYATTGQAPAPPTNLVATPQ